MKVRTDRRVVVARKTETLSEYVARGGRVLPLLTEQEKALLAVLRTGQARELAKRFNKEGYFGPLTSTNHWKGSNVMAEAAALRARRAGVSL